MDTYYLVDFENVHNEGIENISTLTKKDHVHIFYTKNAINGNLDFMLAKDIEKEGHKVLEGDQSLDKHLVSYLGYLLGVNGKDSTYIIVSKDKGYDKVISFWKEKGFINLSRINKISAPRKVKKEENKDEKQTTNTQTKNAKIAKSLNTVVTGEDRTQLNIFVQHRLKEMGYESKEFNRICKYVILYSGSEKQLNEIHNAIKEDFPENASEAYDDVKKVLKEFAEYQDSIEKKRLLIEAFYKKHFKKKIYDEHKEETINVLMEAKTIQDVNNGLLKVYRDGKIVSSMKGNMKSLLDQIIK